MSETTLSHAVQLARAGRKDEARQILENLLTNDPHNEMAWIWLADCAASPAERIETLEACLQVNPNAKMAWAGLNALYQRYPPTPTLEEAAPASAEPVDMTDEQVAQAGPMTTEPLDAPGAPFRWEEAAETAFPPAAETAFPAGTAFSTDSTAGDEGTPFSWETETTSAAAPAFSADEGEPDLSALWAESPSAQGRDAGAPFAGVDVWSTEREEPAPPADPFAAAPAEDTDITADALLNTENWWNDASTGSTEPAADAPAFPWEAAESAAGTTEATSGSDFDLSFLDSLKEEADSAGAAAVYPPFEIDETAQEEWRSTEMAAAQQGDDDFLTTLLAETEEEPAPEPIAETNPIFVMPDEAPADRPAIKPLKAQAEAQPPAAPARARRDQRRAQAEKKKGGSNVLLYLLIFFIAVLGIAILVLGLLIARGGF